MEFFYEIFEHLPRQGPGNTESTLKALSMIKKDLPQSLKVLDIGCGTGMQTIELARNIDGKITAMDNHQAFLDKLNADIKKLNFDDRIKTFNLTMFEMPFFNKEFDLIWCEGAIFVVGFKEGIYDWNRFLKPGGFMMVTDLLWIKENPPEEIDSFFKNMGCNLLQPYECEKIAEEAGYKMTGSFTLPESAWWDDYYNPMEKLIPEFKEKYKDNQDITGFLDMLQLEINMRRKYHEYYGYVCFVMQN